MFTDAILQYLLSLIAIGWCIQNIYFKWAGRKGWATNINMLFNNSHGLMKTIWYVIIKAQKLETEATTSKLWEYVRNKS